MLENLSKVLVVDNEAREIDKISKALTELNIPAYYSLYSPANSPAKPYSGIRLAFFDIKLHDGNHEKKQTINSFVNALKQHIDIKNGPFILIFWTSHTDLIEDIKEFVNKREKGNVPVPILVDCIDKSLIGDSAELIKSIRNIISNDILELIFDYESKVSQAAGMTLKTIFDVVSNGKDIWGVSNGFEENFDYVFSNIAYESYGFEHAKRNPLEAVRDGLNPILVNELNNIRLSEKWSVKLRNLLDTGEKYHFKRIGQEYFCQLNAIYHINFNCTNNLKSDRGIVVEFKTTDEQLFSIFRLKPEELKTKFLQFDSKKIEKGDRNKIREGSKFVLIEISASCDFAQENHRNHIFILGVLAPAFDLTCVRFSDSIIQFPFFSFNGNDHILLFNSRYTLTITDHKSDLLGDKLFRIKNELLNKIVLQYTNYISRIGIIQF